MDILITGHQSNPTGDGTKSVTGLTAGTWTVTVTDENSCTTTKQFTITQPAAVSLSFTSQAEDATANAEGNATFSVSIADATGYQWQRYNGEGYENISNSEMYSGATTSTLSIIGATTAMNGYQYRCVATAACASPAYSNSAKLSTKSSNAFLSGLLVNPKPVTRILF